VIIAGDFNYPGIKWDADGAPSSNTISEDKFIEMLNDVALVQLVNFPTFQTSHYEAVNVLDLIITDAAERVDAQHDGPPLGHTEIGQGNRAITWNLILTNPFQPRILVKNKLKLAKGDYNSISEYLNSIDWHSLFSGTSVNEDYGRFVEVYSKVCSRFIPSIKIIDKINKQPWITEEVDRAKRRKNKLFYRNKNPAWSQQNKNKYNRACKNVKSAIYRSLCKYEWELADAAKKTQKEYIAI